MKNTKKKCEQARRATSLSRKKLLYIYELLFEHFGPRNWWPAETTFEVVIGAILTQNTAWSNVEKAIENLKMADALTPKRLRHLPLPQLLDAVRPSGYYNIKADRIQHFMDFLFHQYRGDLEALLKGPTDRLRKELLHIRGIGPETSDSIILYAADQPIFVVDAYTLRIMVRHRYLPEGIGYEEAQQVFMRLLPLDVNLFKEYHALFVALGKYYCRAKPRCQGCPLEFIQ
jgi:endonuclease-3 related protein